MDFCGPPGGDPVPETDFVTRDTSSFIENGLFGEA